MNETDANYPEIYSYRHRGKYDSKTYEQYTCYRGPKIKEAQETQPVYDYTNLEIVYNIDEASLYSGGKYALWKTAGTRKALCEVSSLDSISNCANY